MGALLNNSNGCPRMPIGNTTAKKAMTILGAEWRPCSKWRHYFCYPREGAAVLVFLHLQPVAFFFSQGARRDVLGFEAGHICKGKEIVSRLYPHLNSVSSLAPRWSAFGIWVRSKIGKTALLQCGSCTYTVPLPQHPPTWSVLTTLCY